jgi:hypothetical protein
LGEGVINKPVTTSVHCSTHIHAMKVEEHSGKPAAKTTRRRKKPRRSSERVNGDAGKKLMTG